MKDPAAAALYVESQGSSVIVPPTTFAGRGMHVLLRDPQGSVYVGVGCYDCWNMGPGYCLPLGTVSPPLPRPVATPRGGGGGASGVLTHLSARAPPPFARRAPCR